MNEGEVEGGAGGESEEKGRWGYECERMRQNKKT